MLKLHANPIKIFHHKNPFSNFLTFNLKIKFPKIFLNAVLSFSENKNGKIKTFFHHRKLKLNFFTVNIFFLLRRMFEEEKNEWNVKKRKKNWDCENISTLLCSYFAIENGVYSLFTYGINKNLSLKHFFGIFCAFSWYNHAWMPVNTWIERKKEFFNMNLVVVLL